MEPITLSKQDVPENKQTYSHKKKEVHPKSESFFSGVLILTLSGLLVKALGMLFKIPMNYIVGDTGMGYYNAAYTIYTFFYMLSTAGLPSAVSILVAAARAEGKSRQCRRILMVSLGLFLVIGTAGTVVMACFANGFADLIGAPPAAMCILAVSPTLFFICIASALRGYFQGCSRMVPTAVSQLLEAVCKVGAGVLCAMYAIGQGFAIHIVAAYAVLGLTLGAAVSMLYLVLTALFGRRDPLTVPEDLTCPSRRKILAGLAAIAVPITVSSSVMSLTGMIDAVLIQRLLQSAGMTQEAATTLYGNYTSLAVPLFNLPPVLVYPIAYAMVPMLTRYRAMGETGQEKSRSLMLSALRMSVLIGAPCALGMSALAEPILSLLYRSTSAHTAAPLLTLLAPSSLLVCMLAITNSILQSIGKAALPVYSMLAGGVVKIAATLILIPVCGMTAAPVGTFLCYLTGNVMNLRFVLKHTGLPLSPGAVFLRPILASAVCAFAAVLTYRTLTPGIPSSPAVLFSICTAAAVYGILIWKLKILRPEDLSLLPGKEKWQKRLGRIKNTDHIKIRKSYGIRKKQTGRRGET